MAGLTPYKPGQGYWTRILSAIGFGTLAAYTAQYVYTELVKLNVENRELWQGVGAGVVLVLSGILIYYLVYVRRGSSEFLIATEGEMRKVNWSTRREVIGSTWVVIAISAIIALILFGSDLVFRAFFDAIGVLKTD